MKRQTKWDEYLKIGAISLIVALAVGFAVYSVLVPVEEPVERTSTSYGWLREEQFTVTGTGTAGSAAGNQDSDGPIRGHVYAMHLDFASGISTTTDVAITLSSPSLTVLDLSNYYTDTWYYPAAQQTDSAGAGTSTYDRMSVSGHLNAAVEQSSAMDVVTVTVWWGE